MVADDSSDDGGSRTDPAPPAEAPTDVVNVGVAVSRVPSDESLEPSDENREPNNRCSEPSNGSAEPSNGRPKPSGCTANIGYLFIVRGENEAHTPGALGFPGGTVEAPSGEAGVVESTARREAREEVGVDVADSQLVTSTTFESDDGERVSNLLVAADYAGGEAHPAAPAEVAAVEWRTVESVLADDETPSWTREQIRAVRR